MKTQIHDLRKVRMWYEVKELSSNPGNSDSKIAKKLGIDRRTVSRYKKMSEDEFHEFSMKQRVYELVLSPYYPDVLSLLSIDNGLPGGSDRRPTEGEIPRLAEGEQQDCIQLCPARAATGEDPCTGEDPPDGSPGRVCIWQPGAG